VTKAVEALQRQDRNKGKSIDYRSKTSKAVVQIETDTEDEDEASKHAQSNRHLDHNEESELEDDEEEVLVRSSRKRQSVSEDRQEDNVHNLNNSGLSQANSSDQYITMSGHKESEPDDASSISGNNDMEPDNTDAVSEQNSEKSGGAAPHRIPMMDVTNMSSNTVNIVEKEVKRRRGRPKKVKVDTGNQESD